MIPVADAQPTADQPVSIQVDAAKRLGPLRPIWSFFGHDEPNYTYMKDGRKLLSEIAAAQPGAGVCARAQPAGHRRRRGRAEVGLHQCLYRRRAGKPVYDWTITDRIFDTYMERKMKPLVQIGFMPQALSSHPEPYRHHWKPGDNYNDIYTGWAYPRRTTPSGANWFINGCSTACRSTAAPKSNRGSGKSGTSPISATGRAPRRNITSSTTTPRTP